MVEVDYNRPETRVIAFKDADKLLTYSCLAQSTALTSNLVTEAKNVGIRHIVKQSIIEADAEVDVDHLRLHHQAKTIIEE